MDETNLLQRRSREIAPLEHYLDYFYAYLTLYSVTATQLVLQLTMWVDSHHPELLLRTYVSRFGVTPGAFFAVSGIFLFASLVLVRRIRGLLSPILGGASIIASMAIASVPLVGDGPLWVWAFQYIMIAAIYGFSATEDLYGRALGKRTLLILRMEYEEHRHLIGYLIQGAGVIFATGGIGYLISEKFQQPNWCGSNTCGAWSDITFFMLVIFGWGVFGVFILRYYLTMQSLKQSLAKRTNATARHNYTHNYEKS